VGCIACAALVLDGACVTLTRTASCPGPVEADSICPDRFMGLGTSGIAALPAMCGGERMTLGDLFEVDGAGTFNVTVCGDLTAVQRIGEGMTMGRVTVTSDVGARLGAQMRGGEIVVDGAAGDHLGAEMSGGRIVVLGDAGREAGMRMSGGLILVLGDARGPAGAGMSAGSLVVGGRLGESPQAGTAGGTVVALGDAPESAPRFRYEGLHRPAFLSSVLADLEEEGLVKSPWVPDAEFRRFVGDLDNGGEGEVLVRDQSE
jgi:formylmethanofuran dehydrogenase subunit C